MGKRGPKPVSPQDIYLFAHQFYWDFVALVEGSSRRSFDRNAYQGMKRRLESADLLSDADKARFARRERQIRDARLSEADKGERLRRLEQDTQWAGYDRELTRVYDASMKELKIPPKPEVLNALLTAREPEQVRRICEDAFTSRLIEIFDPTTMKGEGYTQIEVPNWPISIGSMFPRYLSQYAEQFIAAKNDVRFPRANRPSNQRKQLWFLSRALAGALYNVETRTAINLVGSTRPEQMFEESHAAKPARRRRRRRNAH